MTAYSLPEQGMISTNEPCSTPAEAHPGFFRVMKIKPGILGTKISPISHGRNLECTNLNL